MPSPPLPKFCFCATLPTGGVVIGALQAGYYALTLIGVAILLSVSKKAGDTLVELAKEEGEDHRPYEEFGRLSSQVLWPIIVLRGIGIGTSALLIYGTQKRNKLFVMPYLIYEGMAICALVLMWFLTVPGRRSRSEGVSFFLFLTLYIVLNKYFWMCILSLYIWLSNEQRRQQNGDVMIPLQTIPEHQRTFMPNNNAYPLQQQPLYIPQPINAYPQQQMYPGQHPPAYPVQTFHSPMPEKV